VKRKLVSSKNSSTPSKDSALIPYQALMLLKPLFKHSLTILTECDTDTLRWSTSLVISKYSGTITVAET